ncbi:MAG: hypothetical protein IT480_17590 [Gammaproteobacteria bacterium]|nr:hypothetical protein [Gammaproteobacteria bacterium]
MRIPWKMGLTCSALGLVVLLAAACGSDHSAARRARSGSSGGAGAGSVAAPGVAEDRDLNAAVSLSPKATLFDLKFRLTGAPVVGRSGSVELVVAPVGNVAFDSVHLSLRPGEGLRLLSDSGLDSGATAAGEALRYQIQYLPDAAGVLTLGVTLVVDAENNSLSRTYTIPLIAVPASG